jgi:uncharacterized protein YbjT (DUF2867 family)
MKILIIGATGSLAEYVIKELKTVENVSISLFARNTSRLSKATSEGTNVIQGDAMNFTEVKNAVQGQDMVYINLAGDLEKMTENIVRAMKVTGVNRVIAISSIGIYVSPLKPVLMPYRWLADIIEDSGLDYTILRPDWFTSDNEVDYAITNKGTPESGSAISRKSIAAFIATIVQNPELHKNENLGISKP